MNTKTLSLKFLAAVAVLGGVAVIASNAASRVPSQASDASAEAGREDHASLVSRGKYLVDAIGCADCHTPMVMGPKGPERDAARHLSGHPESLVMPAAPKLPPGPWLATMSATMTAWSGPWGTSFTANLTPDGETGLGTWTAQQFIDTIRTQRHLGRGRALLPPMPAEIYANLVDDDLRAIFAYLQSIPAIKNRVPQPIPPAETN